MILSILTSCHNPSPDVEEPSSAGFYVRSSSKRHSLLATPVTVTRKNSRLKKKLETVVIGTPSGFRHEFHLGRDVNTRAELWDLERWRQEIEHRVQEAAAQHAAINAAAFKNSEAASVTRRRTRPESLIKRKPVPPLYPNENEKSKSSTSLILAPTPALEPELPSNCSTSEEMSSISSCCLLDGAETSSVISSLPPSTPPSTSPRVSTDMKFVDDKYLSPVVEGVSPLPNDPPAMKEDQVILPDMLLAEDVKHNISHISCIDQCVFQEPEDSALNGQIQALTEKP